MSEKPQCGTAEQAARFESERRFSMFEFVDDAVFLRPLMPGELGGRLVEVNGVACRWLGYSREELKQKSPLDIYHGVTAEQLEARNRKLLAQGSLIFETQFLARDGHIVPVEINSRLVEWEGRQMMLSVARDLTERKRAEDALRKSEENFRNIFENAPIGIYQSSLDCLLAVNPALAKMFGYDSPAEMLALTTEAKEYFVDPNQRQKLVAEAVGTKGYSQGEVEYRRRDGSLFTANLRMRAVHDKAGAFTHFDGFVEDVTERRRAEQKVKHLSHWLLRTQRISKVGGWAVNLETGQVWVSPEARRIYGAGEEEAWSIAQIQEFPLPHYRPMLDLALRQLVADRKPYDVEFQIRRGTDGALVAIHSLAEYDAEEAMVLGVIEDVTERKSAEAELLKAWRAVEQSPVTIVITDLNGSMEYVNPKFTQMTGYTKEEALGKNPRILKSGRMSPEDYECMWETLAAGNEWRGEFQNKAKDGRLFWEYSVISPIVNKAGQITHYLAVKEDITERKRLEEQLRQAQKMEAIGRLAGGVAHDFNNILAATMMNLGLLRQSSLLNSEAKESLQDVEREILRATNLTRQLLLFSRRQVARVETFDLNVLIEELLIMLRRLLGENILVAFDNSSDGFWLQADRGMMEQVVMNLCLNARDAMPRGGKLTLDTSIREIDSQTAKSNPEARPGSFVCLSVTDAGCGMDEAVMKRIFEPFFTTKEIGKGTGLGLATVYGVIKQHDGWVEVESKVGQGSSFRVYLPAGTKPADESATRNESEELKGGSETILLVEDEVFVRRMAALSLRKLGYAVLEAAHGVEALKVWEEHRQNIALLFTDMVMPETLTGMDLAERFKKDKPNLKVIISSGYSNNLTVNRLDGLEISYLAKPYSTAALARTVRHCLDRGAASAAK